MQYRKFKDNIELSMLGMGNMRLPVLNGDDSQIDYDQAKAIIDECMRGGINYYDTAYIYHNGQSEAFLGKALAEYPRDSFYVADKFNVQANPDYKQQLEHQLERLGMDRIDFYLLHGVQDDIMDVMLDNGCIDYFDEMKKQGKIRYLGFSYHGSPEQLPRMLKAYPWDFVQIQLNYYDWYYGDAKELYEILEQAEIPVMVMEPVHGGMLAKLEEAAANMLLQAAPEQSLASWAMRWVKELPGVQVILSGMSTMEQVKDNLNTFQKVCPVSPKEQELIKEAVTLHRETVTVACTGCRYCCPDCPQGLDIPALLKLYNDMKIGGVWRLVGLLSKPEEERPSACIGCGSCTGHCPQSFNIPKYMEEMTEVLAKLKK